MKTTLYFFIIAVLSCCLSSCITYPSSQSTEKSVIIKLDGANSKTELFDPQKHAVLDDNVKYIFLQSGSSPKIVHNGLNPPSYLSKSKEYSLKFFYHNASFFEDHKSKLHELIPMVNSLLDGFVTGIKVKLDASYANKINEANFQIVERERNSTCNFPFALADINIFIREDLEESDHIAENSLCPNRINSIILSGGAIFNVVTLAHEIMHKIGSDSENNHSDILYMNVPKSEIINIENRHFLKLSNINDAGPSFSSDYETFLGQFRPSLSSNSGSQHHNHHKDRMIEGLKKEIIDVDDLPYMMHPEVTSNILADMNINFDALQNELNTGQLPTSVENRMKNIYKKQYEVLTANYEKTSPFLVRAQRLDFSGPDKTGLTSDEYIALSLENLTYLRSRNILYILAVTKKNNPNGILKEYRPENSELQQRFDRIFDKI